MEFNLNNSIRYLSLNDDELIENTNYANNDEEDVLNQRLLIKELTLYQTNDHSAKSGSETWKCMFSPDEKFFAWSSGFGKVSLVPKHVYLNNNHEKHANSTTLYIDCDYLVRSLLLINIKSLDSNPLNFWPKSALCKSLFLVTGHQNGRIRIWDTIEGKLLLQLNDHKATVTDLATTPIDNSLLISCSYDGTIKIRNLLNEGNLVEMFTLDGQQLDCIKVSSNGRWLAACGSGEDIYIWDMNKLKLYQKLTGHQYRISCISFSPDSFRIASVSFDTNCILWNVETGKKLAQFNHLVPPPPPIFACGYNGYWIRCVCFSLDNNHLLTLCDDDNVRIWDLDQMKLEQKFRVPGAISCKYSPSGQFIAIGTKHGNVKIFNSPKCVKSLLNICRSKICETNFNNSIKNKTNLPNKLINYLNYDE